MTLFGRGSNVYKHKFSTSYTRQEELSRNLENLSHSSRVYLSGVPLIESILYFYKIERTYFAMALLNVVLCDLLPCFGVLFCERARTTFFVNPLFAFLKLQSQSDI